MAEDFIQLAWSGGELSPAFIARSDVEKYDLGFRNARNWFVDYRGGASTRPQLEFVDYLMHDDKFVRIVQFQFNTTIANTYAMVFGDQYIRFIQDGAYVLETPLSITNVTNADPAVVTTSAAHGYSNGDWVKVFSVEGMPELDSLSFEVANVTSNTFELLSPDGTTFDSTTLAAYISGGSAARIYTVSSPYLAEDLRELTFDQFRDEVTITGTGYAPRKLIRSGSTNWTLSLTNFYGNTNAPTGLVITPSAAGTASILYAVTAVDLEGKESYAFSIGLGLNIVDVVTQAGHNAIGWNIVPGAQYYNVYRSIVQADVNSMTHGYDLYYIGRTFGNSFIDNNITADATKTPPNLYSPFANGAVLHIDITSQGSGYPRAGTVPILTGAGGSGFAGYPVVDSAGAISGVRIVNPGANYPPGTTVTFSGGGGSGAAGTVILSEQSGNNPKTSTLWEQRRVYAGTENKPMTVFGSRVGAKDDFTYNLLGTDASSYELSIDSPELTPIKYMIEGPLGLFVFTEDHIKQIRGINDAPVTASSAKNEQRGSSGIGDVQPLRFEDAILYLRSQSTAVKEIKPTNLQNTYEFKDLTVFSSHFFKTDNPVQSWAIAPTPLQVIWAQRKDGSLLCCTYVPEHNVYAWTKHSTLGYFDDVESVKEDKLDRVYCVVKREINGRMYRFIERMQERNIKTVEDLAAVDSCVASTLVYPSAMITIGSTPTVDNRVGITVTADSAIFTSGDVGKHLRCGGGRGTVASFVSSTEITVDFEILITDRYPEADRVPMFGTGDWSLTPKVNKLGGLYHLEGETVQIFADGDEYPEQVVSNGMVNLDAPASKITIGLAYSGVLTTLPLTSQQQIITSREKRVVDVALRLLDSRGLFVAETESDIFYELKERTFEAYGEPTAMQDGIKEIAVTSGWNKDGSVSIKKSRPFHSTLLGLISTVEIGT